MNTRNTFQSNGFLMAKCCLCLGLLAGNAWAESTNRYVVHPDNLPIGWAPDTEYLTWQTAATNIQTAVTKAVAAVGDYVGDTVVVTDGVFRSSANPVVNITKVIHVRSVKGPAFTSIDGQGSARCVQISANATLSGFTIKNGFANNYGAGVYNSGKAPLISNCVIVANAVTGSSMLSEGGGGVFLKGGTVRNCQILSNIYTRTGTFGNGAGVTIQFAGLLADSTVRANSALTSYGGGVFTYGGGTISNCVVSDNVVQGSGGGIFVYGSDTNVPARRISGCIISNNTATEAGGISLNGTPNYVEYCRIVDNVATGASGNAGGIFGTLNTGTQRFELVNSEIVGNSSKGNGSGMYFSMKSTATVVIVRNVLIARNSTKSGLYMVNNATDRTRVLMENVTMIDNNPYGAFLHYDHDVINGVFYGNTSSDISFSLGTEANSVFHSCFSESSLVNNNINSDPGLVNPAGGDYRLASGSPCINVGSNLSWMSEQGAVDLDGRPRLDRFTRLPDMGAYEYVPPGSLIHLR